MIHRGKIVRMHAMISRTLNAAFAPRELPDFGPSGLSSLGLGGAGIPATFGGGPDDPTAALVDNLSADFIGGGTLWMLK